VIVRVSGGAVTQATTYAQPGRSTGDASPVSGASHMASATSRLRIVIILLYWLLDFRSTDLLVQLVLAVWFPVASPEFVARRGKARDYVMGHSRRASGPAAAAAR